MCTCEFCTNLYEPRSQVKYPRACNRKDCQRRRQRTNEKDWHNLPENKRLYDAKYYYDRKEKNRGILRKRVVFTAKAIEVGCRFFDEEVAHEAIESFLNQFFTSIGLRQINKLWPCPNIESLYALVKAEIGQQVVT
jgi:hypothetical protein